ncbi:MAG: DUF5694 domain-containing protein [Gemmatimonadaceae bacterium]
MKILNRVALMSLAVTHVGSAQDPVSSIRPERQAHVAVLGMFHFQDAGLDAYKPTFMFDIRSPQRQRELEDVIVRLAAWRPTRIAIESRLERQGRLDSLYRMYPGNGTDTLRSELYQIGFRLARRLGLAGVTAVDAPARYLDSTRSEEEWTRRQNALVKGPLSSTDWNARFTALYRADDSLKTVRTLRETLLYINSPERLLAGHGHYLVGDLLNGGVGDYLGADGFISAWYNRNVRIYSNIARLIRNDDERILVIFGAGHVPILQELLRSSPVLRLDDMTAVLR